MNILKRAWQWLTTKHQKESTVTDQVVETSTDSTATDAGTTAVAESTTAAEATTTTTTTTVATDDSVLDQVKELLVKIGHDVESEWDEVVALAKKLVIKSAS